MRLLSWTVLALLLGSFQAVAATPLSGQDPQDTVTVGVLRAWPPHYIVEPGGRATGFAVDVMDAVAELVGLAVRYHRYATFPDAIDGLRRNEVDVIPDLGIISEREAEFRFTRSFGAFRLSWFVRASDDAVANVADLRGRRVGVVSSNAALQRLPERYPEVELVVLESAREALFELLAADVDAVVYPEEVFLALARSAQVEARLRTLPEPFLEVRRGMAVGPADTALAARLDAGVEALVGTPTYETIYRRWFQASDPFWSVRRVVVGATGLLLLLGMVMAWWRYRSVRLLASRLQESLERREELEEARTREGRRFRTLVETAYEGIVMSDPDNRIAFANDRVLELVGASRDDLVERSLFNWVAEEHRDRVRAGVQRRREGEPGSYEALLRGPTGKEVWVQISVAPLLDDDGSYQGSVATLADITDRIRAEKELEETTRLLRRTLNSLGDAVFVMDPVERTVLECNPAAETIFGYGPDEMIGLSVNRLHVDEDQADQLASEMRPVLEAGHTYEGECLRRKADGTIFPAAHVVSLLDPDVGMAGGVVSVIRDLSEREQAEKELRESEARFRELAERIDDAFWVLVPDADGLEYVSPAYREIWGRSPELIMEDLSRFLDHVHPDDREAVKADMRKLSDGPTEKQYRIVRPDGSIRWVWDRSFPIREADGTLTRVVGVAEDVTDRVRAQQALSERERRFRAFIEHAPGLISTLDAEGRMQYQSPAVERLLGYSREELEGDSVFDYVHRDDRDGMSGFWARVLASPGVALDTPRFRFRHRDGSWRIWEVTVTNLLDDPAVEAVLSNGKDVTEQDELERRLRQSQKLEAVGRLAGGVAHDFNNLLTVIRANVELLKELHPDSQATDEHLEEVEEAATRGADLTRQLLAFSRDQILQPRPTDLNAVLADIQRLLRRVIGEDVALETELEPGLPPLEVDPGQLDQIIMNLAVNARDAMPRGGELRIRTTACSLDEDERARLDLEAAGRYLCLEIQDTGRGMDEETRERIFEPFFTTKPMESGTGLGLATVYGAVRQSGGAIEVDSAPGDGTTFRLFFPATDADVAPAESVSREESPRSLSGEETILVVEDDPNVRRITRKILERYGYVVQIAGTVEAARGILDRDELELDLLLTDMVLPDGSGIDLIDQARTQRPLMSLVAMSGYSRREAVVEHILEMGTPFLGKPFTPEQLASAVRSALDDGDPA